MVVRMQISTHKRKTGVIAPKRFVQRLKRDNELFRSYMHQASQSSGPCCPGTAVCTLCTLHCSWRLALATVCSGSTTALSSLLQACCALQRHLEWFHNSPGIHCCPLHGCLRAHLQDAHEFLNYLLNECSELLEKEQRQQLKACGQPAAASPSDQPAPTWVHELFQVRHFHCSVSDPIGQISSTGPLLTCQNYSR